MGPRKTGKLVALPALPLPGRGTVSNGVLSRCSAMLAWGMGWCRQNEAVFLPVLCGYSQVFFVPLC